MCGQRGVKEQIVGMSPFFKVLLMITPPVQKCRMLLLKVIS